MSDYQKLLAGVVAEAERNLGFGEMGSNNSGPFIKALGGVPYGEPSWCALFVCWCYRKAADELGMTLPFTPWRRRIGVALPYVGSEQQSIPEAGAYTLAHRIGEVGRLFSNSRKAQPGDVVLWHRVGGHHIGLVERVDTDGITYTIEGNVGKFPAKVKRLAHDTWQETNFATFASILKL